MKLLKTFAILTVLLLTVSTASAACTPCTDLKITDLKVSKACNTVPCKIGIYGYVSGNVTQVKYEIIDIATGKTLTSSRSYCKECVNTGKCFCSGVINTPGAYDVKMTAYGASGCCVSKTLKGAIVINAKAAVNTGTGSGVGSCVPAFTATKSGNTVSFKEATAGAKAVYWNFGDGYISRSMTPCHTYKHAGTYHVCMSVKCGSCGSGNCWKAVCKVIKI